MIGQDKLQPHTTGETRLRSRIYTLLKAKLGEHACVITGLAFLLEPGSEPLVADVGVILDGREKAIPDDDYLAGAPELVVMMVSPSNPRIGLYSFAGLCLDHGSR